MRGARPGQLAPHRLLVMAAAGSNAYLLDGRIKRLLVGRALRLRVPLRHPSLEQNRSGFAGLRESRKVLLPYNNLGTAFEWVSAEKMLERMKELKPSTGYGETYQYSNAMIAAAGYVAAHAANPKQSR